MKEKTARASPAAGRQPQRQDAGLRPPRRFGHAPAGRVGLPRPEEVSDLNH